MNLLDKGPLEYAMERGRVLRCGNPKGKARRRRATRARLDRTRGK